MVSSYLINLGFTIHRVFESLAIVWLRFCNFLALCLWLHYVFATLLLVFKYVLMWSYNDLMEFVVLVDFVLFIGL